MLLTVVIYVLLGYEDNKMCFGYVSSMTMERPSSCSEQPNEVCNLSSLYAQLLGFLQRLGCCLFPIGVVSLGLC